MIRRFFQEGCFVLTVFKKFSACVWEKKDILRGKIEEKKLYKVRKARKSQ